MCKHPRNRQRGRFGEDVGEVLAFDVRHRDVLDAVDLSQVVDADDVRMRHLPGEEQLTFEACFDRGGRAGIGDRIRPNDLERERDFELGVPRLVNGPHPANAEQSDDSIPRAEELAHLEWPFVSHSGDIRAPPIRGVAAWAKRTRRGGRPCRLLVHPGARRRLGCAEASDVGIQHFRSDRQHGAGGPAGAGDPKRPLNRGASGRQVPARRARTW